MDELRNRLRAAFAVLCGHAVIFGWRLTPDYLEPLRVRHDGAACSREGGAWIGQRRYHALATAMVACKPGDVVLVEPGVYSLPGSVPRDVTLQGARS